jgi:hypothetical protein
MTNRSSSQNAVFEKLKVQDNNENNSHVYNATRIHKELEMHITAV